MVWHYGLAPWLDMERSEIMGAYITSLLTGRGLVMDIKRSLISFTLQHQYARRTRVDGLYWAHLS